MAQAVRNQINGTSGQDIMKMNENFEQIWTKVHGDITFGDSDSDMQNRISTQWLPFQGEGNFDSNFPLDIRFFVPPNVKKLKSSSVNITVTNYRMDSSIAMGGGGFESGQINLSMVGGKADVTLATEPQRPVSSDISMLQGASTNSTGLRKAEIISSGTATYYYNTNTSLFSTTIGGKNTVVALLDECNLDEYVGKQPVLDLCLINHRHDFTIPSHSHTIFQEPHTHSGSFGINIDPHTHMLNEGIKVSSVNPSNVVVIMNGVIIADMSSTPVVSNLDVTQHIKIGEWNTIRCSTSTLARITIYGILELLIKNF